jgi:histidinol-phosphate aminotransferase
MLPGGMRQVNFRRVTTVGVVDLCRPEIKSLPAYNAGTSEIAARGICELARVTRLASNETPFGASPAVAEAISASLGKIYRYPDPHCTTLRDRISSLTGFDASRIVFGNGSEDIIEMLCKAFLLPGDRVVTLAPSFGLHEIFPLMMGATVRKVPANDAFQFDLPKWRSALSINTKLVMFSTPSNPVGCVLNESEFRELVDACPSDCVLVVDEAYYEYAQGPTYADSVKMLSCQQRPWIVLRTLSKAYGLAGLRVGYGLASDSDLISLLDKVRTPFNINQMAQVAAVAALSDVGHLRLAVAATVSERQILLERMQALEVTGAYGLRVAPSHGNFLFIDTARPSRDVAASLMRRGVLVKPWLEPGFETFIRATVGRGVDSDHFLESLATVLTETHRSRVMAGDSSYQSGCQVLPL